jgi:Divergent InlB B-repeat domain
VIRKRAAIMQLLVALGASVLLLAVTAAHADSALAPGAVADQSNPERTSPCRFTGWEPDDSSSWAAQTFTAGTSGLLTDAVLRVRGNVSSITVAITSVDAAGAPAVDSNLASVTVPFPATAGHSDFPLSFTTPAKVEAGKQYAIVLSSSSATADGSVFIAWESDIGASFTDRNGTQCQSGVYPGGRAWGKGSEPPGGDSDFFFTTYVVATHHVTVQPGGAGAGRISDGSGTIACGDKCAADFKNGEVVTLTAVPDARSVFAGWSGGGCSGTASTCSLTVTADTTVTAKFSRKLALLRVRHVGSGSVLSRPAGIRCGTQCSFRFVPGVVVLTARPSPRWHFVRWQGACRGTKATCRVTASPGRAASVTAVFAR